MSMFKGKAGFVIPKNKFSGSLVPIFNKPDRNNAAKEESSKQPQRKTKWGAHLSEDTTVKRGRALAYQTRVDQITQQLKLESLRSDTQNSKSAKDVPNIGLADVQVKRETLECLELERREAIGEILKINPSFKAPPDYQPVVRETTVPIPVKAHPEYNFLDLVFGSDGETQRRLEKDTGTAIKVYGIKKETQEKVEIMPSNRIEAVTICEELYVQIFADSYEKVDAAADLIEMLLSSVLVKPADSRGTASVSEEDAHALGEDQNMATAHAINTVITSQDVIQPGPGPMLSFPRGHFQPNPISWFPGGQFSSATGAMPFRPPDQRPSFRPGPPAPYGFFSSSQGTTVSPRLHSPAPVMQGSFVGQQSPRYAVPQHAERPLTGASSSPGWPVQVSGGPQSLNSAAPSLTQQFPSSRVGPASATSFGSSQIWSSSALPPQSFAPQIQLNSSVNTVPRPMQFPVPAPSVSPLQQSGMPSPSERYGPSFTPLTSMGPAAPRPPLRGSGDFTFQPQLSLGPPSQPPPRQGMHFASQRPTEPQLPPEPQMPSFRPAMQSTMPPVGQSYPRAPGWNPMGPPSGQFGAPNLDIHMGHINHGPAPRFPGSAGSLPPTQFQPSPNRPRGMFGGDPRPGPYGRRQNYDPFLPSALPASQPLGSNVGVPRKQESDPEYEDLMASVGVK